MHQRVHHIQLLDRQTVIQQLEECLDTRFLLSFVIYPVLQSNVTRLLDQRERDSEPLQSPPHHRRMGKCQVRRFTCAIQYSELFELIQFDC
jgi:hypothetical protein